MGVTRTEGQEDAEEPRSSETPHPNAAAEEGTTQLLIGTVGDRCANCGAHLASDQRYCVNCGERRGKSRFGAAPTAGQPPQPPTTTVTSTFAPPPRRRGSYGATLVAGIATLILAMGVGVEIGRIANSNNSGSSKPAQPVITVNDGNSGTGSGSSVGAASTPSSTGGSSSSSHAKHGKAAHHSSGSSKKAKQAAAAPKPSQAAVQKAAGASDKVTGGAGQPNTTVTTGQSCQSGSAGCQGGHFTGNFFGG